MQCTIGAFCKTGGNFKLIIFFYSQKIQQFCKKDFRQESFFFKLTQPNLALPSPLPKAPSPSILQSAPFLLAQDHSRSDCYLGCIPAALCTQHNYTGVLTTCISESNFFVSLRISN